MFLDTREIDCSKPFDLNTQNDWFEIDLAIFQNEFISLKVILILKFEWKKKASTRYIVCGVAVLFFNTPW